MIFRSIAFYAIYLIIIADYISVITAIPLVLLLIAVYSISNLSLRENMEEFDKALSKIKNIDKLYFLFKVFIG